MSTYDSGDQKLRSVRQQTIRVTIALSCLFLSLFSVSLSLSSSSLSLSSLLLHWIFLHFVHASTSRFSILLRFEVDDIRELPVKTIRNVFCGLSIFNFFCKRKTDVTLEAEVDPGFDEENTQRNQEYDTLGRKYSGERERRFQRQDAKGRVIILWRHRIREKIPHGSLVT